MNECDPLQNRQLNHTLNGRFLYADARFEFGLELELELRLGLGLTSAFIANGVEGERVVNNRWTRWHAI